MNDEYARAILQHRLFRVGYAKRPLEFNVMQTIKFKRMPWLMFLTAFILLFAAACASPKNLPTDDELIAQWTQARSELRSLIESCASASATYSLAERYQTEYPLIPTTTVENLEGCELPPDALATGGQLKHLTRMPGNDAYLLVTHQYRKGTGWIEESISRWTGGWISWKATILEEKGFVYIEEEGLKVSELPLHQLITTDAPLDQFSGEYRVTSQISGNGCEIWRLRPTEPGWYLFYHQVRECAV